MTEENNKQPVEAKERKESQKSSLTAEPKPATAMQKAKEEGNVSEYKSKLRRSIKNAIKINSLSHIDSRDAMKSAYLNNYQQIMKLAKTSENKTILNEISRIVVRGYRTLAVPTPKVTAEVSYNKMKETYDRYEALYKALSSNKIFMDEHTNEEKRIAKARHRSKTKMSRYEKKAKSTF